MKSKYRVSASVGGCLLLGTVALLPMAAQAGGSLNPPGAPAVTMKSLQEIEPRTIISGPTTITAPGSYYLSNNIVVSGGDAIDIAASGVTLDLNGFTISSTAASANGYGIYVIGVYTNISIFNGSILGGVHDNGSGTFTGPGFAGGIWANGSYNVLVSHVNVSGMLNYGIILTTYYPCSVESCIVNSVGAYGIYANVVRGCSAYNCGGIGGGEAIGASEVSDSQGSSSWAADGIDATTANNCYGYSYTGFWLSATTANNCYGSTGTGYEALSANVANNCYGYATSTNNYGVYTANATECYGYGGYAGVYAYDTAIGCYGDSSYGYGILSTVAENCYGYCGAASGGSTSWAGIYAESANNCYGDSYYWSGIQASTINNSAGESTYGVGVNGESASYTSSRYGSSVQNSYGYSYYSVGLYGYCVNNSYGYSQVSLGLGATTAENSYGDSANSGAEGLSCVVANNCYGYIGGTGGAAWGLSASVANNCYGYCGSSGTSGIGILATCANNCYGYCSTSQYGVGVESSEVCIGTVGYAYGTSSTGLSSYIANSCYGNTESISYKYNMP